MQKHRDEEASFERHIYRFLHSLSYPPWKSEKQHLIPVAGAGSHTLGDALVFRPLLPAHRCLGCRHNSLHHSHHRVAPHGPQCVAQLPLLCSPGPFPFVLKWEYVNFFSCCLFFGICESQARSLFHRVHFSGFWVELPGHIQPSLLPSYRHSPKFASLFAPSISN